MPSHYLNYCWVIVYWTLRNRILCNFNQNSCIFIQENAFENVVCKMAPILSQSHSVNTMAAHDLVPCGSRASVTVVIEGNWTFLPWCWLTHWGGDKIAAISQNIFKCNFWNENAWISLEISLKFIPKDLLKNIPPLVQIMAWCRRCDIPLSEPMISVWN